MRHAVNQQTLQRPFHQQLHESVRRVRMLLEILLYVAKRGGQMNPYIRAAAVAAEKPLDLHHSSQATKEERRNKKTKRAQIQRHFQD